MLLAFQSTTAGDVELRLPLGVWLGVAFVAVVIVCVLVRALDEGGRRDRAIQRLASARGWRHQSDDPAGLGDLRFLSFSGARGAHVTNVVTPDGREARVRGFDYSLLVERVQRSTDSALVGALADDVFDVGGADRSRTTYAPTRRRTGAIVRLDAFCPSLIAAPAGLLRRALETAGAADLDFESVEFNRNWDVRCADRRFAWLFFDASMIDLVLQLGAGVTVETFGNYVLFSRELLVEPDDVIAFVDLVARVPEIVNPLVREEHPTATEIESRAMVAAWEQRPDGRGGRY